jgi:hypothetical protein
VQAIFAESGRRIVISHLTVVEMRSVYGMKVRTGAIDRATGTALATRFQADIAEGLVDVFAITPYDYRRADGLLAHYAFDTRLRSLDALQLAVALDLRDQGITSTLVAADLTVTEIANREGLSVVIALG